MTELYAQALFNAAQEDGADAKKLVANLAKSLSTQGRLKLLPDILRSLQRLEARNAKLASVVEAASEKESAKALKEAAAAGIHAAHAVVNEALIKGWRATSTTKLVDASAKRSLVDLYRSVAN